MKTVAWIPVGSINDAAARLRVFQVAAALRSRFGVESVFPGMPMTAPPAALVSQRFDRAAIALASQLGAHGTRTFLDLSANVWDPGSRNYNHRLSWGAAGDWDIDSALTAFQSVIAASPELASQLTRVFPDVHCHILRDYLDFRPVADVARRRTMSDGRYLIGWFGVEHNLIHIRLVLPALRRLAERFGIRLRVISNALLFNIEGVDVEFTPWDLNTYRDALQECDVMVIPMEIDPQNSVRSTNRLLECMGLGLPAVVSPVPAYLDILDHHPDIALVAYTEADWLTHLERLLSDAALRIRMAESGRGIARAEFSIEAQCHRWQEILFGAMDTA